MPSFEPMVTWLAAYVREVWFIIIECYLLDWFNFLIKKQRRTESKGYLEIKRVKIKWNSFIVECLVWRKNNCWKYAFCKRMSDDKMFECLRYGKTNCFYVYITMCFILYYIFYTSFYILSLIGIGRFICFISHILHDLHVYVQRLG